MKRHCLVLLLSLVFASGKSMAAGLVLTGDTSRPSTSTFAEGEPVGLVFHVTGQRGNPAPQLEIKAVDEQERLIWKQELPVPPEGATEQAIRYAVPAGQKLGFYRVYARLSTGETLSATGFGPAGYLSYCIVPDPAKRPLYDDVHTRFGLQGGYSSSIQVLSYLGVRWINQGNTGIGAVEPDHAGQIAERVEEAKRQGKTYLASDWTWPRVTNDGTAPWLVYPLPSLYYEPPKWAVDESTRAGAGAVLTPEGEVGWRNYCLAFGKAFAAAHPEMKEHLYQITWEPIYPWGFKGTDEQLIRIYEIAYPALHEADPKAKVYGPTGCNVTQTSLDWNARLLQKGLGKYLDGFSIHPYLAAEQPEVTGLREQIRQLKELIRQHTGRDLPMIGTEQGLIAPYTPSEELKQARRNMRQNLVMLGEGFGLNFAFYIVDNGSKENYGYYYNLSAVRYGADKVSPRPVAAAYAAQSFLLEGEEPAGAIEWLGGTSLGYAFEVRDEIVLALWDGGDGGQAVTLPVGARQVEVYDWMGNPKTVATPDGMLRLTLTPEPVYIKGAAMSLWGRSAIRPVQLDSTRLVSYPGGKAEISGSLSALAGDLTDVTLEVQADPRLRASAINKVVSVKKGEKLAFRESIPLSADMQPGFYPIKVLLRNKDGVQAAAGLMLQVAWPIEIQAGVSPGNVPALQVSLSEQQGAKFAGKVNIALKGIPGTHESAVDLGPHETKSVTLSIDPVDIHPAQTYTAKIAFRTAEGLNLEKEVPVDFWKAAALKAQPVIDGDLSDWTQVPPVELKGREWVIRTIEAFRGTDSLSANVRFAWDSKALYLACEVAEDKFSQNFEPPMMWKGDCVMLGFNLDPDKKESASGNTLADAGSRARTSELAIALMPGGPQAMRFMSAYPAALPTGPIAADLLKLAVVRKGDRLYYEAAIPWSELGEGFTPREGARIGMALTVNQTNPADPVSPVALGAFRGIYPTKEPEKYGILVLGTAQ
jgi:hypothetical protein